LSTKSEERKNPSSEGQGEQITDSVFDFIYYDARRVASFLSQFDKYGHLSSLVRKESAQRAKTDHNVVEATGGVPLIASAKGSHQNGTSTNKTEESAYSYDPFWTNARALLDYIDERSLMTRVLDTAHIGQLVLLSGQLEFRDLRLIQKAMALPSMAKHIKGQSNAGQSDRRDRRKREQSTSTEDVSLEIFSLLPHSLQIELKAGGGVTWGSLNEANLVVDSSDIFLKHGVHLPGTWNVLGVLDALPSIRDNREEAMRNYANAQNRVVTSDFGAFETISTGGVSALIDGIVPMIRLLLGRRDHQYGVTPLLIFREVAPNPA
jgi:hypothetical protein